MAEINGRYYSREWGFGLFFEAKVASEIAQFLLRADWRKDGFWSLCRRDRVEGGIAVDAVHVDPKGAHLRWFICSDSLRGQGYGKKLLDQALTFCRSQGYSKVYLWTFKGLHAARHLYEQAGFRMKEERSGSMWGEQVREQRFELQISGIRATPGSRSNK